MPNAPKPRPSVRPTRPAIPTAWDRVARWYDQLVGDEGSDYHRHVILPATLRLLDPQPGEKLLDLCCGQGVLARRLLEYEPACVLAVDASPKLIAAARSRGPKDRRLRYEVNDVTHIGSLPRGEFDAAACVMALQDVADLAGLCANLAQSLRPGGRVVTVMMHPCFRIPRQSNWGWDEAKKTTYRRLDRYATPLEIPIATHPGRDPSTQTLYFHRPLADYLNALGGAGLAVMACEELLSHRRSESGRRRRGEHRAAREFPVFLALKLMRSGVGESAVPR